MLRFKIPPPLIFVVLTIIISAYALAAVILIDSRWFASVVTVAIILMTFIANTYFWWTYARDSDRQHEDLLDSSTQAGRGLDQLVHMLARQQDTIDSFQSFQVQLQESSEGGSPMVLDAINGQIREINNRLSEALTSRQIRSTEDTTSTPPPVTDRVDFITVYEQVASEFAHQIRTPLGSVKIGVANLSERLPLIIRDGQSISHESSQILIDLLQNAIDSIEYMEAVLQRGAGFIRGDQQVFRVQDVVRRALRMTRDATRSTATVHLSVDEVPSVRFYWLNLLIALTQVLENAFQAAGPDGNIGIAGRFNESTANVEIDVVNSGQPVPEDAHAKLFEGGFSTKEQGRGLGLAIAFRSLQAADGNLELVHSTEQSTMFRISFNFLSG